MTSKIIKLFVLFLWWILMWWVYLAGMHDSSATDNYFNNCTTQEDYDLLKKESDNDHKLLLYRSELVDEYDNSKMSKQEFLDRFYKLP